MTHEPAFWRFLPGEVAPDARALRIAGERGRGPLARALREARAGLGAHRAAALLKAAERERRFGRPLTLLVAAPFQPRAIEDALLLGFAIAGLAVEIRLVDGFSSLGEALADRGSGLFDGIDMTLIPTLGAASSVAGELGAAVAARSLAPVLLAALGAEGGSGGESRQGVEAVTIPLSGPAVDPRFGRTFGDLPSPEAADRLADAAAGHAARLKGMDPKLVVTDLDDTLWRGTLGEAGAASLSLHHAYAQTLKGLTSRGFVLCAASRNDPHDVDAAFAAYPEWPIARHDFAAVAAGWEDKDVLVDACLRRLGLASEHMVFIDDDPVNCARTAARFPDADVRLFAGDPDRFAAAFAADLLLAGGSRSNDARSAQYRRRESVERLRAETPDVDAFLRRLRMQLTAVPLQPVLIPRAAELAARVNQFTLADLRPTTLQLAARASPFDFMVRLDDAFGSHGLVGLVLARGRGQALAVDNIFLSCRALGRGVEQAMLAELGVLAARHGLSRIEGTVEKLSRNEPARRCFSRYMKSQGSRSWAIDPQHGGAPEMPEGVTLTWDRTTI